MREKEFICSLFEGVSFDLKHPATIILIFFKIFIYIYHCQLESPLGVLFLSATLYDQHEVWNCILNTQFHKFLWYMYIDIFRLKINFKSFAACAFDRVRDLLLFNMAAWQALHWNERLNTVWTMLFQTICLIFKIHLHRAEELKLFEEMKLYWYIMSRETTTRIMAKEFHFINIRLLLYSDCAVPPIFAVCA